MTVTAELSRDDIIAKLRPLEAELRKRGITSLSIFGSRSRGDARPDSDLDVLVDINPDVEFSLFDLVRVQHLVQDTTGLEAQATISSDMDARFAQRISDDILKVF
ncbi:MAG: nucleotidyltransferase domain-containing protein [Pseudolabrys sp.]|nr:nucleotidyltransferase domain-containing protein [Pseudolabrys sp.]